MLEKIKELICQQLDLDPATITEETTFVEDLCCDSLDIIELITAAEEEFDLGEIPEEDLAGMKTVGDLFRYAEKALQEG